MAKESRRRRMSRHISLVLLGALPGLAGCGGCQRDRMVEVEEVTVEPPPEGPELLIGAPFIAWWEETHPPTVVRKFVKQSEASSGGYYRGRSRVFFFPIGGRSTYMGASGYRSSAGASHSGVARGGFGSSGHSSVGG